MSDEIIKLLDDLGSRLGIAIDWSSKNITPYLKDLFERYIDYEITTSLVWIVIFAICVAVAMKGIYGISNYANKKIAKNEYSAWNECKWCFNVFFIIFSVISIIGVISQTFDVITCIMMPEKMWFAYLKSIAYAL